MATSEHKCGNCGNVYQIDTEGERIQACPKCGSPEMVKDLEPEKKK